MSNKGLVSLEHGFMRVFSVAERELRAAARRKSTYQIRWITAVSFFVLLAWMLWAFGSGGRAGGASRIFECLSLTAFFYCIIGGATRTADSLSEEKREGTLGLLFLTNLNSAEILAGKLCANLLAAAHGLLALFPILALPLLMGGVTAGNFWQAVLALLNAVFFSVSIGFVASVLCVRQFAAIALAMFLGLFFTLGLPALASLLRGMHYPAGWVQSLEIISPFHTLNQAGSNRRWAAGSLFWNSLAAVHLLSWLALAAAAWQMARTWRDRVAISAGEWLRQLGEKMRPGLRGAGRLKFRRRLLAINPFFWLASRRRATAILFLLLLAMIVTATVQVLAGYAGRMMGGGVLQPLVGHFFAWFGTAVALHILVLYFAALTASQGLAEDKQCGALELILSSPVSERRISQGLWLAYARALWAPILLAVMAHGFVIWHAANLFLLDGSLHKAPGMTAGKLIWMALLDKPLSPFGAEWVEWQVAFMVRVFSLALVILLANWIALGSLGRWLGVRLKHPGFAPILSVALVLAPPWVLFGFLCWFNDEHHIINGSEREVFPVMMWIGFGIGIGHSFLISAWASGRLHRDLREVVTSRYQPATLRFRWRLPSWRLVLRVASAAALLAALIVGLFQYRLWSARRGWIQFERNLASRGESLDLAQILPKPVSDDQNFARSQIFENLVNELRNNPAFAAALSGFNRATVNGPYNTGTADPWMKQEFTDWKNPTAPAGIPGPRAKRPEPKSSPAAIMARFDGLTELMHAAAQASFRPFLQVSEIHDGSVVFGVHESARRVEQLHYLFRLRSSALLETNATNGAFADVLASLRLAGLARQLPDQDASTRVQAMVCGSLQPIWEGMARRRWDEAQLAAIQSSLASFELLSDHTNAIQRIVRAYISRWRQMPEQKQRNGPAPFLPAIWYDRCIQLYEAGQRAMARVDVRAGRIITEYRWSDFGSLPLEGEAMVVLQQWMWQPGSSLVALAQNAVNQAIIACALERYRIARGRYPEALADLVPAYLPRIPSDPVRGRPMIYEPIGGQRFILRGVGPNEMNDQKKTPSDDWLWTYPLETNAPPSQLHDGSSGSTPQ